MSKKGTSQHNKAGKKLFGYAIEGFYYFENDQIEELLDKVLIKFDGRPDWRKATRAFLWSFPKIRQQICDLGYQMFGDQVIVENVND